MDTLDTKLKQIKSAQFFLAQTSETLRNRFLTKLTKSIRKRRDQIYKANQKDVISSEKEAMGEAFIERLTLSERFAQEIKGSLSALQLFPDPIGRILEKRKLANKVLLKKVSVPLGVLLVIYEARPEVTLHAAALAIKSGNAIVLKGGKYAMCTNTVLTRCISEALTKSGLPQASVVVMPNVSHGVVQKLLVRNDIFDLVIPRGGYTLVKDVEEKSTIPVLSHSSGGARIYVDVSADLSMALKIIIDAKTDKPAACNSVDTVLVHQKIAHLLIPKLTEALKEYGVVIKNNRNAQWDREFLDLYINIGEVANVSDAISHIQKYGKGHSECIIAQDKKVIDEFVVGIDVAAVFVNCSPRLHDGGVFGKSMEMGIATGKLHARGPVGLNELTSYKWIAYGNGQIRG